MSDLVGYSSIALVCLITLIIALYRPSISSIIFTALAVRLFVLFLGHYYVTLPDSSADANAFDQYAWLFAKDGFSTYLSYYPGQNPHFLSWLIGFLYLLFGQSKLMAQSISLLFGLGTVFLGWNLAKIIWDNRVAKKVAWILALFPSLVLYSVLFLREIYIIFFYL